MANGVNVGEVEQSSMVVLYDSDTGEIVHVHECVTVLGGTHPTQEALEEEAREQASRAGVETTNVSLLHVDPESVGAADTHYRVDTNKGALVGVPQPKRNA
jgi:hypothetical protein